MNPYSCSNSLFFLIRSLDCGGAERQLVLLAAGLARLGHQVVVIVFYGGGPFVAELEKCKVRLIVLNKRGRWDFFPFFFRLACLLRKEQPSLLHGYMTVSNLLVASLKPLLPNTRIVWGIRASNVDMSSYGLFAKLTVFVERMLSGIPDLIIANSIAGKNYSVIQGFPAERIIVIPNGIDTVHYVADASARKRLREEWGIAQHEIVIGLAARLDVMKGHSTFLRAARLVVNKYPCVKFVCVGGGDANFQQRLKNEALQLGIGERLIWLGVRADMPAVYSALDIAISSSSFGEGFSNSIAEAMSCGLPCVVTNVGDSAWIVGKTGIVVPPNSPQALADALLILIALPAQQRIDLGALARQRIAVEFGVKSLIARTERLLS